MKLTRKEAKKIKMVKTNDVSETNYDFAGWATRNDIKCADGRTIRKDAFMTELFKQDCLKHI